MNSREKKAQAKELLSRPVVHVAPRKTSNIEAAMTGEALIRARSKGKPSSSTGSRVLISKGGRDGRYFLQPLSSVCVDSLEDPIFDILRVER
jgi:hypothetical protein